MRISTLTAALMTLIVVVWMASYHVRSDSLYIQDLGQSVAGQPGVRLTEVLDVEAVRPDMVGGHPDYDDQGHERGGQSRDAHGSPPRVAVCCNVAGMYGTSGWLGA